MHAAPKINLTDAKKLLYALQVLNAQKDWEQLRALLAEAKQAFTTFTLKNKKADAVRGFLDEMLAFHLERIAHRESDFKSSYIKLYLKWRDDVLASYKWVA